jgi:hypothetical protein
MLGQSRLIATCLDEHMALAREAEATDLLRPIGWLQLYPYSVSDPAYARLLTTQGG